MKKLIPLLVAAPLAAQSPLPPVRLINAAEATSQPVLGTAVAARQLPNGSVMVNDIGHRQLVLFDHALGTATVVADSASGAANSYGPAAGALTGFLGDSLLFIDPRDLTTFVLDPNGAIARVAAVPRSQDASAMGSNLTGKPALDSRGRLVYRGILRPTLIGGRRRSGGGGPIMPSFPDSAPIVRVSLATRDVDTAGYFKIAARKMRITQTERGISMTSRIDPMPVVDDFAVMTDGSIAVVRGQDYHIDWISPDGAVQATAKIPFDWQRLTDEDKIAVIDSARSAMERDRAAQSAGGARGGGPGPQRVVTALRVMGAGGAREASVSAGELPPLAFVDASELPDYRPAFSNNAAHADLDGHLWIRTSAVRAQGVTGPIYDVVNREGRLIDRVQIPGGRRIIGFGRGGVVYMSASDARGTWVERTTWTEPVRS